MKLSLIISILMLTVSAWPSTAYKNLVWFIEPMPSMGVGYTVKYESKLERKSLNLAFHDFITSHPRCNVNFKVDFPPDDDNILLRMITQIKSKGRNCVIIGVGKSQHARLVAKLLSGSQIHMLSFSAATQDLQDINKNAFSLANPVGAQTQLIARLMRDRQCAPLHTVIVRDNVSVISRAINESVPDRQRYDRVRDLRQIKHLSAFNCIYITLPLSASVPQLKYLESKGYSGHVFGTTEWSMIKKELSLALKSMGRSKFELVVPTGFDSSTSVKSKRLLKRLNLNKNEKYGPFLVYAYEAAQVALDSVCTKHSFKAVIMNHDVPLIRKFKRLSKTGSFLSKMGTLIYPPGSIGDTQ